ncbi:MAG: NRDE family protein [Pseudomonadota bacterium]
MCTILIAHQAVEGLPLAVAANRDEFYARRTESLTWREGGVMAGRDLRQGGYWMAADQFGRFAALTNYRNPPTAPESPVSRGHIVRDFIHGDLHPKDYIEGLIGRAECYEGFNLLLKAGNELWYYGHVSGEVRQLPAGIYGLSNHLLDTPWPKVVRAKGRFEALLEQYDRLGTGDVQSANVLRRDLAGLLEDRWRPPDGELPDTGVPLAWERRLSPLFVASLVYGTRSASVVTQAPDGELVFSERRYGVLGRRLGESVLAAEASLRI